MLHTKPISEKIRDKQFSIFFFEWKIRRATHRASNRKATHHRHGKRRGSHAASPHHKKYLGLGKGKGKGKRRHGALTARITQDGYVVWHGPVKRSHGGYEPAESRGREQHATRLKRQQHSAGHKKRAKEDARHKRFAFLKGQRSHRTTNAIN